MTGARIREHAGLSDTEGRGSCAWGPQIADLKGPASKHSRVGTRCLGTRTLQPLTGCCPGSETGWGWPHSVHHGGCPAELNWEACHSPVGRGWGGESGAVLALHLGLGEGRERRNSGVGVRAGPREGFWCPHRQSGDTSSSGNSPEEAGEGRRSWRRRRSLQCLVVEVGLEHPSSLLQPKPRCCGHQKSVRKIHKIYFLPSKSGVRG